jgi:uncharacterized protein (UPF0335 family)
MKMETYTNNEMEYIEEIERLQKVISKLEDKNEALKELMRHVRSIAYDVEKAIYEFEE